MTKREQRVIKAFLNCIAHGEYTVDYAITLIEDNQRYGWMSENAKEYFYDKLDEMFPEEEEVIPEEEVIVDEPTEEEEVIEDEQIMGE